MIVQKQIRKASELSNLVLAGLSIESTLAGNGGTDFSGITFKDAKTGTIISVNRGPYSDLTVHATLPVKMEKRFIVVQPIDDGEFRSKPLKEDEVSAVKYQHPGCTVIETDVSVEE